MNMLHAGMKWVGLAIVVFLASLNGQCAHAQQISLTAPDGLVQLGKLGPRLGPGSVVVLKPGIYRGGATLSEVRGAPGRPVVIMGEKGAIIESWTDKAKHEYLNGSSLNIGKCSNIEIRGLEMSGAVRGITLGNCKDIVLRNNNIHDIRNYGIMSYFSSNVTISDNLIERSALEHGIYISGDATKVVLTGNTIRDTHINGIHINGKIVAPVVEKNTLERTGLYPTKEGGAGVTLIGGVTAPLVQGNTFKNIYGQGITVGADRAVIAGNTFESYSWSAILALPTAQSLTIEGNRFEDRRCIPLQLPASILGSLKAVNNTYAIKDGRVFQDSVTEKVMTLKQWKASGKD